MSSVRFEVFKINAWPLPLNPEAYMDHRMEPNECPSSCPVFNAYLEVAMKADGHGSTKASHTPREPAFSTAHLGE
jgi:hypothetical protein